MGKSKRTGTNKGNSINDLPIILSCIMAALLNMLALKSGYIFYSLLSITPFLFIITDTVIQRKRTKKSKNKDHTQSNFYMFLAGLTAAILLLMALRTGYEVLSYISIIPCVYVIIAVLSRFAK